MAVGGRASGAAAGATGGGRGLADLASCDEHVTATEGGQGGGWGGGVREGEVRCGCGGD